MGQLASDAARKLVAALVLVVAAFLLFKIVIGAIAAVVWMALAVVAVIAVIWAIRVL
jgi:hypothetical protein